MIHLRGEYYVRQVYGKLEVVSEHDDDELYITGIPTVELATRLREVVNTWRQEQP